MAPLRVTVLHGSDQDGKEVEASRNGHLTERGAEVHLWRLKWQSARMQHNVHQIENGVNKRITEGPWVTLDLSQEPTKDERKKVAGKAGRLL